MSFASTRRPGESITVVQACVTVRVSVATSPAAGRYVRSIGLWKQLSGRSDRDQARAAVFEWIEGFYNRHRIHATLDFVSPSDYEAQYEMRSSTRPEIRG